MAGQSCDPASMTKPPKPPKPPKPTPAAPPAPPEPAELSLDAPLAAGADDDEIVAASRLFDRCLRGLLVAHQLHAHRGAVPRSLFGERLIDLLLRAEPFAVAAAGLDHVQDRDFG